MKKIFNDDVLDETKWSYQEGTGQQYGLIGWGNLLWLYIHVYICVLNPSFFSVIAYLL